MNKQELELQHIRLQNAKLTEEIAELKVPQRKRVSTWLNASAIFFALTGFYFQWVTSEHKVDKLTNEAYAAKIELDDATNKLAVAIQDLSTATNAAARAKRDEQSIKINNEALTANLAAKTNDLRNAEIAFEAKVSEVEDVKKRLTALEAQERDRRRTAGSGVQGKVLDHTGKPVSNVVVSVEISSNSPTNSVQASPEMTGLDGAYALSYETAGAIDLVFSFGDSTRKISGLSGSSRSIVDYIWDQRNETSANTIAQTVSSTLKNFDEKNRLYFFDNLPADEQQTIRRNSKLSENETIYAALKDSGDFSEAIVFTDKGVHFSDSVLEPTFWTYKELATNSIKYGFISILINDKKVMGTGYAAKFQIVLSAVQAAVRNKFDRDQGVNPKR